MRRSVLVIIVGVVVLVLAGMAAAAPTVTVTSPANGATVANPVKVVASATGSSPISRMEVWVNGSKVYSVAGSSINSSLTLPVGSGIRFVVQAVDSTGATGKVVESINVTSGSTSLAVNISSPANGATVADPVSVVASASGPNPISRMEVWVNGAKIYQIAGSSINTSLNITPGSNIRFVVQAIDSTGGVAKQVEAINVTSGGGGGSNTVTINSPASGSTVNDPVHVTATANLVNPLSRIEAWIDGSKTFTDYVSKLDTQLTLAPGSHRLTVQAIDNANNVFKATETITVDAPAAGDVTGLRNNVRHIIFMLQENRSTDNYFGKMDQYRQLQGAAAGSFDGIPANAVQVDQNGTQITPFHYRTVCAENQSPAWNESHSIWNFGHMNRFMQVATGTSSTIDPFGHRVMGYYDQTDLPFYYEAAWQFATSDRWFSPVMSGTNVNRMYSFAASSFGHIRPDSPPAGGWPFTNIFTELKSAGVTWRVYLQDQSNEWSLWSNYDSAHVAPISQFATDVQNEATLPQVIYIERGGTSGLDEHPDNNVQTGAADVANITNTLLHSPSWGSSIFILSFDEFGGLYDHVQPQFTVLPDSNAPLLKTGDWNATFNQTGFRVPLMVFSPWVKPHYVSHTTMDSTAILRLIETRFSLPAMTARDAVTPDMLEFFNFNSPALATPPALPVQPTSGTCDKTLETGP